MKTIGFFGDSFCAGREPESWCVLLADRLNARIVHWGEPGRSVWSTFFKFNQLNRANRLPDICVLCYTEPYRLYHPSITLTANTEPVEGVDTNVYKALEQYWVHLHNYEKDELSYEYAIQWFDQHVLKTINKEIIQLWSFRPFETAGKDAKIKLTTGIFIDESMLTFSKQNSTLDDWKKSGIRNLCDRGINHMTIEQNKLWADKVYTAIKNNE
jgi:hypothetical protein